MPGAHPGVIGKLTFSPVRIIRPVIGPRRQSGVALRFITESGLSCDDMILSAVRFPPTFSNPSPLPIRNVLGTAGPVKTDFG